MTDIVHKHVITWLTRTVFLIASELVWLTAAFPNLTTAKVKGYVVSVVVDSPQLD